MLGGRLISANTQDEDERKLLNVVEEMAIASGTAVPQVYVLPKRNRSMLSPPGTPRTCCYRCDARLHANAQSRRTAGRHRP